MGNAVQERQNIAVRRHGWRDGRDRSIEIICLAGQDHRVIDRRDLRCDHSLHCQLGVPERALDPQPLLGENLAPSVTDQKRDVGSALGEAPAEIAAGAAGSEHQDLGLAHSRSSSFHRPIYLRLAHALKARIESKLDPHAAGSRTMKWIFGPAPDRCGPNSTVTSGQFDTCW